MIEKAYIVVVTEEQRPAVARVHVIGSQGDWRLVQSAPYRREGGGFEFAIHSRNVHRSWIALAMKRISPDRYTPGYFLHRFPMRGIAAA